MPLGIPIELNAEQAALYSSVGSMISAGIGADRAYKLLRDSDNYMPRSTVRAIAGEIRASLGYRQQMASQNPDRPISPNLVTENSSLRTDNFVHTVSMLLRDKITGYTFQQFYNYVGPDLVSPNEAYNGAVDGGGGDGGWYEFDIIGMSLVSVSHAP